MAKVAGWQHERDVIRRHARSQLMHGKVKMIGQKRLEPPMGKELRRDPTVWRILWDGRIEGFLDALNGHNSKWTR